MFGNFGLTFITQQLPLFLSLLGNLFPWHPPKYTLPKTRFGDTIISLTNQPESYNMKTENPACGTFEGELPR